MKKIIYAISLLSINFVYSQDISDAIRYSLQNNIGTARYNALGGAFGALGGDLSAMSINPASSSVFSNNFVALTGASFNNATNSNFFGSQAKERFNSFDINQGGGVFVFEDLNGSSKWKKFAVGVNFENLNNFDGRTFSFGVNPLNSATQFFINNANGIALADFDNLLYSDFNYSGQQGYMAYQAFLINPATNQANNTLYFANTNATANFYQENLTTTNGYNGKVAFNASGVYNEKLHVGINLNAHFTDFRKSTTFLEDYSNSNNNDKTIGVQSFVYNNDLFTYGNGFSFQLGAIYKVNNNLRAGLSYESPTWLRLNDELQQSLQTTCADCPQSFYNENPGVVNIYAPYKLKTPSKITSSLAYIFGKKGLISFDFASKDYGAMKFNTPNLDNRNVIIENTFTRANEYRVGVEHRFKEWSFRGGYRFEESPYKNKNLMGNLMSYSGGIGYNFGNTKLDFAYSFSKRNGFEQFFSQGMTNVANQRLVNNNIVVTVGFEL